MTTTAVPRWRAATAPIEPAVAEHVVPLSRPLVDAVAAVAQEAGVPLRAALLAAHLRVVGLLAGEAEVSTALVEADGGLGLLHATIEGGPWRKLVAGVPTVATGPVSEPDTAFALDVGTLPAVPLCVSFVSIVDGLELRVRYRTADFDAAYAARVAGYLTAALGALADDPDGDCLAVDLMSAEEREHLVYGRDGGVLLLPDRRFHELFAEVAAAHPDTMAAVHNGRSWSYAELDQAANRVAHALLANGLAAEDIVAVATERTLGWLAAIIGIFKAGGAYLPVEPQWPAARVATLLEQSGCRLVLAESPLSAPATVLRLDEILHSGPSHAPDVAVGPGQLAYVYFTSGSTGLPKGAMCEHAGMVNHLLAKVRDVDLGPDSVVLQNAQSSFDISLWQLIAPMLVGGRTVLVDRATILDVPKFVDTIVAAGTTVLQVVPSYLDVLLRYLEQEPRALGALRFVSVTGEAISKALVVRWFAQYPEIRLVNAYGATEASDDTTHEVMAGVPDEDLVPVGRPVDNVTVYVLGPQSTLVPLGSIGEVAFSGVCVGRGYVNDPTRTAEAFTDDPFRPGERIYRTGDFGRWLPTGSLEFHGRRDEQVKIQGIRIELGEVEARALAHPAVRGASVVVTSLPGSGKSLVLCFVAARDVPLDELRQFLAAGLPAASVPARAYQVDILPLNANGKVDKKALVALAQERGAELAAGSTGAAPRTETERRIAAAWAQALNRPVDEVGRDDHFFDLGGTSLSALRVVASLGGLVSLDDLVRSPVLHALAAATEGAPDAGDAVLRLLAGPSSGAVVAVVCAPFAAGGAINFRPLASTIAERDPDVAVYGVQPPGHDLGRPDEPLLDLPDLAARVAEEARATGAPVVLWGHCAGVPLALESARRLEDAGVDVRHVFVAARPWESERVLTREIARVVATPDGELAEGHGELAPEDLAFVGRAYRHDTRVANVWLLDAEPRPLRCALTVVRSSTDPVTPNPTEGAAEWGRFAAGHALSIVDGGGHEFVGTRPAAAADLVLAGCGST